MTTEGASGLPRRFVERLERIVPSDQLAGVLASFSADKPPTFRVNSLRGRDEEVLAELAERGVRAHSVEGLAHVYRVEPTDRQVLMRCDAVSQGRVYVQNLSSALAAPLLDVQPGMRVLDLASAPGGKTLHLACLMNDAGTISAVESMPARFYRLRNNLRLHGVTCCRTFLKDGRGIGRLCSESFDRVLLDAPCSGEAMLRSAGTSRRPNWSERKVRQCAGKQRELLVSAVHACRPGGRVLYCTCSMAPEENEGAVADVLDRFPGQLEVEPLSLPPAAVSVTAPALLIWRGQSFPDELDAARRILPDDWFDAFFLCRLRKRG